MARSFDQHFTVCINFRALCDIIESLTRDNMQNHEDQLSGLDVSQAQKDMALSKCASSKRSWVVKKNTNFSLHAVTDAEGRPRHDPDEAADSLRQHWGNVFSSGESAIRVELSDPTLSFVQPALYDTRWAISWEEFQELFASKRESHLVLTVYHVVCIVARGEVSNIHVFSLRSRLAGPALPTGFGTGLCSSPRQQT